MTISLSEYESEALKLIAKRVGAADFARAFTIPGTLSLGTIFVLVDPEQVRKNKSQAQKLVHAAASLLTKIGFCDAGTVLALSADVGDGVFFRGPTDPLVQHLRKALKEPAVAAYLA
ncbi:MAG: hypothetical protein EBR02_04545 [Alphaproteobacteria bacterium]|nr:hypothetical protein [Alphaproteobacteria bacterium]